MHPAKCEMALRKKEGEEEEEWKWNAAALSHIVVGRYKAISRNDYDCPLGLLSDTVPRFFTAADSGAQSDEGCVTFYQWIFIAISFRFPFVASIRIALHGDCFLEFSLSSTREFINFNV